MDQLTNDWCILIDKQNIIRATIDEFTAETEPLAVGEIEVTLDSCGLTSNNVTYAVLGEAFRYWYFFPSGVAGKGLLPVWGFATVTRSSHTDVAVGEVLYGYFPLGSRLILQPQRVNRIGLYDGREHRQELAAVYNQYTRLQGLPPIPEAQKDLWPILRPLLITGFMIADQFFDQDYYGAEQVVISSASSKTALMTAFCFGRYADRPQLIGLTSARNQAYVRASGLYDQVMTYDELEEFAPVVPSAFVDIAGNKTVAHRIHTHFAEQLKFSLVVGISHWTAAAGEGPRTGPRMVPFFAPGRIEARSADWGAAGLRERTTAVWQDFLPIAQQLTTIEELHGPTNALDAYNNLVQGKIDPKKGLIARF